jgi:hypothetical protein
VSTDLNPGGLLIKDLVLLALGKSRPEIDSLTSVAGKVVWANNTSLTNDFTSERRQDWHLGLVEGDGCGSLLESIKDRVHLGRVEGERNIELGVLETLGSDNVADTSNDLGGTAENSLLRSVDASNLGHLITKKLLHGLNVRLDGKHAMGVLGAVAFKKLSTSANKEDHIAGRDNPSDVEGSIFAKRVTNDSGRLDTPRSPHAGKGNLDTGHAELNYDRRKGGNVSTIQQRDEGRETLETSNVVELINILTEGS